MRIGCNMYCCGNICARVTETVFIRHVAARWRQQFWWARSHPESRNFGTRRSFGRAIYAGKWLQSALDPTCETILSFAPLRPRLSNLSLTPFFPFLTASLRFTRMQKSAKHPEETSDSWSDAINVSLFVVENYSLPQLCTIGLYVLSIISYSPICLRIEIVFRGVKNTVTNRSLINSSRIRWYSRYDNTALTHADRMALNDAKTNHVQTI